MSTSGLVVLVATLGCALLLGLVHRARSGRVRPTAPDAASARPAGWELADVSPAADERLLLLQLSSPICTPCRRTATRLAALAERDPGLRHVEIDIAERPDVARVLDVRRTPTTVVFDRSGTELARVSGEPRQGELEATLAAHG